MRKFNGALQVARLYMYQFRCVFNFKRLNNVKKKTPYHNDNKMSVNEISNYADFHFALKF